MSSDLLLRSGTDLFTDVGLEAKFTAMVYGHSITLHSKTAKKNKTKKKKQTKTREREREANERIGNML